MLQAIIVALLVIGCTAYAAWTLMPSVWRRSLGSGLLALPLPQWLAARLIAANRRAASGCGCDGCDRAPQNKQASAGKAASTAVGSSVAPQPITFHRQIGRR